MDTGSPKAISRRALLGGAAGLALASSARADMRVPVAFVSHGSPLLAIDPVRGAALRAWGAAMSTPRGVVVMTPHFASRGVKLGPTGRGFAMFNMPRVLKRRIPEALNYPSPPSDTLAVRVEALLAEAHPVERTTDRRGFDHTTWIPLHHLLPAAEAPVVEVTYPFLRDADLLAFGRRLAPLRSDGVLFVASGGITHNLAAIDFEGTHPVPSWSSEFDAWIEQTLAARDVDALVDWRKKAPAAELAHPDDGAHYRVLLVALGVALGPANTAPQARYPLTGFEAGLSSRCIELS